MDRQHAESTPSPPANGGSGKEIARNDTQRSWMQFAGLGTELSATTLALAGIGYVVDSVRDHQTLYATAVGVLVGFTFGMFRFIQKAAAGSASDPPQRDKDT